MRLTLPKKSDFYPISFTTFLKWLLTLGVIGIITGTTSTLFLLGLNKVSNWHTQHSQLIYALPIAGLLLQLFYSKFWQSQYSGNEHIINRIQLKAERIPMKLAPLTYLATLWSHLFGASVGREGAAVQISCAISDQFNRFLKFNSEEQQNLLLGAISGGFAGVFGTPAMAAIFALEAMYKGKIDLKKIIIVLCTSYLANVITHLFHLKHVEYPTVFLKDFATSEIMYLLVCSIVFGLASKTFIMMNHSLTKVFKQLCPNALFRIFIGSLIIVAISMFIQTNQYNGLGIASIEKAFKETAQTHDFLAKMVMTSLAISIGFKGGEVTPLFFIGATLGSTLTPYATLPSDLMSALGMVAVFGSATKSPWASAVMGAELFGWGFGIMALPFILVAKIASGKGSIYSNNTVDI